MYFPNITESLHQQARRPLLGPSVLVSSTLIAAVKKPVAPDGTIFTRRLRSAVGSDKLGKVREVSKTCRPREPNSATVTDSTDFDSSFESSPMSRFGLSEASAILLSLCLPVAIAADQHSRPPQQSNPQTAAQLKQLIEAEWQRALQESPTWASQLGDKRYNRDWPDRSLAAIKRSEQKTRDVLQALRGIDMDQLAGRDRLNYRLFLRRYQTQVSLQPLRLHLLPLNQRGGIQNENNLTRSLPFDSERDYEDWIIRLQKFPGYMDQTIALMKQGIQHRIIHPKIVLQRIPDQIRRQLVSQPEDSLYYEPFRHFVIDLDDATATRLRTEAAKAIADHVLPAYRRFLTFFETEYLPAGFDQVGCWQRPAGQQGYALLAQKFTTTRLTPQEIHDIGLSEVARIRTEMEQIKKQVGFQGTFQEFLQHLRTDPQFYYDNGEDLLAAYRACCARIDPKLPLLFHRLPGIPYEIVPIPAQMAPDTTTAYYQRPSADGSRPGRYFVNLYRPEARPKFEIEALSLHEAVPGHHFQIALAMELKDVPEFRRYGGQTAFIEGWGLYSEKLGEELGLYQDPYSKFGQLTYEMWRAIRLVVDTGMHHLKWTRDDAIDVFRQNTSKSMLDIENEIDRYIAWPGQALAYKIGELRIRELRARAEDRLGQDFDVRDFHQIVLQDGAVPLDVLEQNVDQWLNQLTSPERP